MTIKENLAYLKYFGLKLTFFKTLNTLIKKSKGKLAWKIHDLNNQMIEDWIKRECNETYKKYLGSESIAINDGSINDKNVLLPKEKHIKKNDVIWTMWWQGEERAPAIVKACITSMRKYGNGHPVIVLDQNNYTDYVRLPEHILIRYNERENDTTALKKCMLDTTKLSNIIRCYLLMQWGGLWLDATVFLTDALNEEIFHQQFVTSGQDDKWYIGHGKWATFCMACQANSSLASFIYLMHIEYWKQHRYYVNYLMFDHIIDIAYQDIPLIKSIIDSMLFGEKNCLTFNRRCMDLADYDEIEGFLQRQHIHKLSWKWWGNSEDSRLQINNSEGKLTWFGYLYNKYMDKSR